MSAKAPSRPSQPFCIECGSNYAPEGGLCMHCRYKAYTDPIEPRAADSREIFDPPETIVQRIKRFDADPVEASRMRSVFQNSRECHNCSCHINPPCNECVDCEVCNKEYEDA